MPVRLFPHGFSFSIEEDVYMPMTQTPFSLNQKTTSKTDQTVSDSPSTASTSAASAPTASLAEKAHQAAELTPMQKIQGHLSTINQHKAKVMELCFRCGLYKQGLLHDLSKYNPVELKTGFKYYQGFRSPIDAQKEVEGYSFSWLHHKGRNPHHWEYWLDNSPHGIRPVAMEFNYVVEMWCDRVAASMIYLKDNYKDDSAYCYYKDHEKNMLIHPQTQRQIVYLLSYLRQYGMDATIRRIRKLLKIYRKTGSVPI